MRKVRANLKEMAKPFLLSILKTPLRDGDLERPDDSAYANAYFINANSASAPGIVDADRQPILSDAKCIPVSTAELPSISTLSTATEIKESHAVSIISRRFETVNLLEANPELRMISLLMKKTISSNKSNVTTATKQAVVILLPPVTI